MPRRTPPILQDYVPLSESVDWALGQGFFTARGVKAFTSQQVPHAANNDGTGAERAADVVFASCEEARARGELEAAVWIADVGAGSGLHARLLLDRLRDRCARENRDFYARTTLLATDASDTLVRDMLATGVLEPHRARVRAGALDALDAREFRDAVTAESVSLRGRLRGVFGNYLLDVMPYRAMRVRGARVEELRVRTQLRGRVTDDELALARDELTRGEFAALAAWAPRMAPRYRFVQTEIGSTPGGDGLARFVSDVLTPPPHAGWVYITHSFGAIRAVDSLAAALRPDGFLLLNDYGVVTTDEFDQPRVHERYGGSTAMGVNFPQLEHHFARVRTPRAFCSEPPDDATHPLHARFVTLAPLPDVHRAFRTAFDRATYHHIAECLAAGRESLSRGDAARAARRFREACDAAPYNWVARQWLGRALAAQPRRLDDALATFEQALALNPTTSPELWCDYADALESRGRSDDALAALERARGIDPGYARPRPARRAARTRDRR